MCVSRCRIRDARPLAQGFVHHELPFAGGLVQQGEQVVEAAAAEVLDESQAVAAGFEGPDRLLEGLLVGLPDAHHLADGPHLRAELVLRPPELLERPARELDHDVVAGRRVLLQRAVTPVRDLVERKSPRELRRDVRDRKAGRLRGQGRGARGPRVDLDDHHSTGLGIVGELDVRPADHLDRLDHVVRVLLQPLLQPPVDRQHRRGAERIAGVNAHRVDVLDEADRDHLVLGVAYDLELQLLPADDSLFDQELADQAGAQTAERDGAEILHVVDDPASRAAHRVGGPDHDRIADPRRDLLRFLYGVGELAPRHVDAKARHCGLEGLAVLAALDGVDVDADHLHAEALEHPRAGQLRAEVETGLAAQVGQERIRPLFRDDLGHA